MQLNIIRTLSELDLLAEEWNALLAKSASNVPFLRHEYLRAWWQTLGGGEWQDGELYVVSGRLPDGTLAGLAPLFFTHNAGGVPTLMLLGSHEISDYLDLIVLPEVLPEFIHTLLEHLSGLTAPPWKALDLYNLLDSSPSLPILQTAAARCGWSYSQESLQHCPYIALPGDWDTYLAGINKKQRHEIRRKIRRIESAPETVRWYIVDQREHLEQEIEAFMNLMVQDAAKQDFLTQAMRTQLKQSVQAAFDSGWLQLAFIEVDGIKAAGYLNFDYAGHIWVYNSGLNYDFGHLSPGWVLLGYLLKWANENGRLAFDFMRGDEDYKYRFGATDRFVVRATIRR